LSLPQLILTHPLPALETQRRFPARVRLYFSKSTSTWHNFPIRLGTAAIDQCRPPIEETIAPALAGYFLRGTRRVAARRAECHDKTRRISTPTGFLLLEASKSPFDCLGILALIQHALHVTVRIKFNSISARYWTSVQCRALTVVTAVVSVVCPFGTGAVQGFFDPDQKVVLTGSNLRCWNRVALKPVTAKCRARFAPRKGRHCSARRQCPA